MKLGTGQDYAWISSALTNEETLVSQEAECSREYVRGGGDNNVSF